ncbi:MAG TPA: NAD(P)/FAD-dependent oxidoreductase [Solirubrobacteraceae bacterium]|nr:NAD(P)/FAD-dependent oxidoreductase [Solirubrobacteraceae bacterium]
MAVAAVGSEPGQKRRLRVLVVGAGFGGIAAAIELRRHGIEDVTILERGEDLGGTWYFNTYPGAACDVPSHLYSYSYAQRRDWTRLCSPQQEIYDYIHEVARNEGVDRLVRTGRTVTACSWDEQAAVWSVETSEGERYEAEALVLATGQLHQPHVPNVQGAAEFAGHSFHSAEWDHDYDLAGKRVGVVGSGASAVQFVPEIAPRVARMTVFQRTGNWFLPRKNRPYPALVRKAFERIPKLQDFRRRFVFEYGESLTFLIRHPHTAGRIGALRSAAFMRSQLKDPALRAKAWPHYTFGCKRVLFSSQFLPALERPNVELETAHVEAIVPEGIRTADGRVHELDCIIWATGFRTNDFMFPMAITGRGGRSLEDAWAGGAHAHLGICVPSFPNMFVMYGPNTNTSGGSIIFYLETQAAYLRQAIEQLAARGAAAIEVRPEVESASDHAVQHRFAGTAWTECDSWYRDAQGRIVANWPGYMREYAAQTARLDAGQFDFAPLPEHAGAASASASMSSGEAGE